MKTGDIVEFTNDSRNWIVLFVTNQLWNEGIDVEKPGHYGFCGMWYGEDFLSVVSYGKVLSLEDAKLIGEVSDYNHETLRKMLDYYEADND